MQREAGELWVRCEDVEDAVEREVNGRQSAQGERAQVAEDRRGPFEGHVLERERAQLRDVNRGVGWCGR